MTTLQDVLADCEAIGTHDPDYHAKMIHRIPDYPSLDRARFLEDRCRGQVVLDVGGTGPMHARIVRVAHTVYTIDITATPDAQTFALDLDECAALPDIRPEVVVCGEVIEHLGNPLRFLKMLRAAYACPVVITVPNAFGAPGFRWVQRSGIENVNLGHVAYYSYYTLKALVEKAGYAVREFGWYGGLPRLAEGMIAVVKARGV